MKNAYIETGAACGYDSARNLPSQTKSVWLEALASSVPINKIEKILDLGCGTGRFTAGLGETFGCDVVGVDPSEAMLDVAKSRSGSSVQPRIEWTQGAAESIPLEDEAVDLVFMSQVFHHLSQPQQALREIHRVLSTMGYLAIRNGVLEENGELAWLRFFPAARDIEDKRTPSRHELKESVGSQFFVPVSERIIHQLFASSYDEYFDKISHRGLSALLAISDESFQSGLKRFHQWVNAQPRGVPVYEPVDLFVFQKKGRLTR
jgi:ubiquinone/menaquinone biosynthesis C-methylase UbiE